jgi:hypothetical protein
MGMLASTAVKSVLVTLRATTGERLQRPIMPGHKMLQLWKTSPCQACQLPAAQRSIARWRHQANHWLQRRTHLLVVECCACLCRPLVLDNSQARRPACQLSSPVGQHRRRTHDQEGSRRTTRLNKVAHHGNHLQGIPGKDAINMDSQLPACTTGKPACRTLRFCCNSKVAPPSAP